MQLRTIVSGALVATSSALGSKKKLTLDDNQQVFIENQPILGAGAGEGALGVCRELAEQHVQGRFEKSHRLTGQPLMHTCSLHSSSLPTTMIPWAPQTQLHIGDQDHQGR